MTTELHQPHTEFVEIVWREKPLHMEYQWVGVRESAYPVVVFLHEGLGSIALWKDFPQRLCEAAGLTGLVFSRYGYGNSTPRPHEERWPVGFMHAQAHEVLPALFAALDIHKPWLFGHSDGGSIALLYAARFPDAVSGIAVAAPHIFVEELTITSIEQARETYLSTDLRAKLGRYHADPDSAFWGWNNIWLDPAFRAWNIEDDLPQISCPVLAMQGEDDEYGTLEQVRGIQRKVPQTRLLVVPQCGHSPHRDQPEAIIKEVARFIVSST
ncbi:alpha/beta fold hydrolase [Noviherbaspirillum saxi]|uniref:Alpha/beta hydrolase n=1 Tax=Noviherbaspirillum saxi TaxID=2320863 RepID=A0A3A3FMB4_9BURK|nr:alpha/beta hydrolase [Noviherbaspirillum saxi]RJF96344.1 alpha/beta hydrolase [Noviherbaspirillum saxi]